MIIKLNLVYIKYFHKLKLNDGRNIGLSDKENKEIGWMIFTWLHVVP
jgi:hypothetical protein